MKEIKFLLYTLAISGYTSLWWAFAKWNGVIPAGPLLLVTLVISTFFSLYVLFTYSIDSVSKSRA